jgi:hypothetical protein
MKVTIEILCFEHGEQKVIGAITHETHAIEVAAAAQSVALCAMRYAVPARCCGIFNLHHLPFQTENGTTASAGLAA